MILENDMIQLRPVALTDIEGLLQAASAPEIWTHMSVQLQTAQDVEKYIKQAIREREQGISYLFVIVLKETNQMIGCTSFLDIVPAHQRLEIGATWLNPTYWRTTINTQCKYLLLRHCFETLKYQRVQIKTGHENIRSQRAIERLGATKEGILRNHMIRKEGTIRHTVMYSLINEEWPAIKERFEQQLLI